MTPKLVLEVMEFSFLQASGGLSPAEIFSQRKDVSKRKALSIRRKIAKQRKVDFSKYRPAEVIAALLSYLATLPPLITRDIFPCFAAALSLPPKCTKGLINQILPFQRNLLQALSFYVHRLVTDFQGPLQLICDRLAPVVIEADPAEALLKPVDIFKYLVSNYETIYIKPVTDVVEISKVVELLEPIDEDEASFTSSSSSQPSSFDTMVIRDERTTPSLSDVSFNSPGGASSDSSAFGTMVIREDSPPRAIAASLFDSDESPCGTMVIRADSPPRVSCTDLFDSSEDSSSGTMIVRPLARSKPNATSTSATTSLTASNSPLSGSSPSSSPSGSPFPGRKLGAFREPEEWEKNIISLEKGEWSEGMGGDAFRRWNKQRPRMPSFRIRQTSADATTPSSASSTPSSVQTEEEQALGVILKKMNLPSTAASLRFAQTVARAGSIFKTYEMFNQEIQQDLAASAPAVPREGSRSSQPASDPPRKSRSRSPKKGFSKSLPRGSGTHGPRPGL